MSGAVFVSLDQLDARLLQIARLMTSAAQTGELASACGEIQKQVGDFQSLWQRSVPPDQVSAALVLRLHKTAAALAATQENLARHAVLTQQALQTLFPAAQNATYNVGAGARARNPYGSVGRQSGEFQVIAA